MNRAEHLAWAKARALEYVDRGDTTGAIASMVSDLSKHEDTAGHSALPLTGMLMLNGHLSAPADVRRHIEGFN